MRRHGERRSECAGDRISVVAREKSRDSGWNRLVCCSDCVRSFSLVRNEKLQVLCGSECSKGERQAPRFVILVCESENGRDVRSLGGSVRERHESRCVLPMLRRRYPSVCVSRRMWNETGAGVKRSLRIASRDCFGQFSDDKFELAFGAGTDQGHDDHDWKFRAPAMPEACKTVSVSPAGRVQAWSLVVDGNPGSRDVVFPNPRVGLLEERPAVSGVREETQREELQCQVEDDTAEGLVAKTEKVLLATGLGQCNDRLTARVCTFRVIDRERNEAHSRMEASRDHEHLEVFLDSACVMAEDRESWMCRFSKGRWVIARDKECKYARRSINDGADHEQGASPDGCGVRSGGEVRPGDVDY